MKNKVSFELETTRNIEEAAMHFHNMDENKDMTRVKNVFVRDEVSGSVIIEKEKILHKPSIFYNFMPKLAIKNDKDNLLFATYNGDAKSFDDFDIFNTNSKKWEKIAGYRREPEYLLENFENILEMRRSNNEAPYNMFDIKEDLIKFSQSKNRTLDIWREGLKNGSISFDSVIDREQKAVVSSYHGNNILINGFAGTGKTVVAVELMKKQIPGFKDKIIVFSNNNVKNIFNEELDPYGDPKTYSELSVDIIGWIAEAKWNWLSNKINLMVAEAEGEKLINISYNRENIINALINKIELTSTPILSELSNQIIKDNVDVVLLRNITSNLKLSLEEVHLILSWRNKLTDMKIEFNNFKEGNNKNDEQISVAAFAELKVYHPDVIILDEAPLLHNNVFLKNYFTYVSKKCNIILSYDELQYDSSSIDWLSKFTQDFTSISLNVVYRTTKEIFALAINGMPKNISYISEISDKNSIKSKINPEGRKLSEIIRNKEDIIGSEFNSLVINADIPSINTFEKYLIFTRAKASLVITGKYKDKYLGGNY